MGYDFFDDFDELMFGFGKPLHVRFSTPKTKDVLPSYWKKWYEGEGEDKVERGYLCTARVLGLDPEDIKITVEDYGLCLDGKTESEGTTYSQHIELPISKDVMANVIGINYKCKNGLAYIYLEMQEPEFKKIEVKKI